MHGNSLSSQPIFQYGRDAPRTNMANIKQGYQARIDLIMWFIGQLGRNLTDDSFQVRINAPANQFFLTSEDVEYEGGMLLSDVFGDRMFHQPWDVMNGPPSTPGPTLGKLLGSLIILGGAGRANQISDEQGHTFYKGGLQGPPSKWEDLRHDEGRLEGMARIPIMGADAPVGALPTQLYAVEGNKTLGYDATGYPAATTAGRCVRRRWRRC